MKTCNRCHKRKEYKEFGKWSISKDGLRAECKVCEKERRRAYYLLNRDRIIEKSAQYREDNLDAVTKKQREYRQRVRSKR